MMKDYEVRWYIERVNATGEVAWCGIFPFEQAWEKMQEQKQVSADNDRVRAQNVDPAPQLQSEWFDDALCFGVEDLVGYDAAVAALLSK